MNVTAWTLPPDRAIVEPGPRRERRRGIRPRERAAPLAPIPAGRTVPVPGGAPRGARVAVLLCGEIDAIDVEFDELTAVELGAELPPDVGARIASAHASPAREPMPRGTTLAGGEAWTR